MSFGTAIKELRKERGIKQVELARDLGITLSCVAMWEISLRVPSADMLIKIAEYFGVTVDYLLCGKKEPADSDAIITFPVLAGVKAGFGHAIDELFTGEYQEIPASILKGGNADDYMVFMVEGDSMYPKFLDQDRVLVLKQDIVNSGDIAIITYEDFENGTIKKVYYEQGCDFMDLIPLNPKFKPVRLQGPELEGMRIIGKVVYLFRKI